MAMICLRDFELDVSDIESLVPSLTEFDYYFVITLWPVTSEEKESLSSVIDHLQSGESLFAAPINSFDLWDIGFHLRHTTSTQVIEQVLQFGDLLNKLPHFARSKQLAGQNIGIYIHEQRRGRDNASDVLNEIGRVAAYARTSNKFGNLSYPREGLEITHILTNNEDEEILSIPAAHMSSNKIIYEFGEGERLKQRSLDAINTLRSLWNTPCQIHDAPERDTCAAEFWLERDTIATVGRYDSIEKMNICASIGTYPKAGALTLELYNEDKRGLPIVGYDGTGVDGPFDELATRLLSLPRIEPFTKPRHILLSFSRR